MGIKSQKAVRDLGIDGSDESGEGLYFFFLHIAGDQEGAGNDQGRNGPGDGSLSRPPEIFQSSSVGGPRKSLVQVLVPRLQIKFDTAAGFQSDVDHLVEQAGVHGPVGLPADPEDLPLSLSQGLAGSRQGKGKLGSRVSPEIADAGSPFIGIRYKPVYRNGSGFQGIFSEVPVLAIETIEGAGVEKDGKVLIASFRACAMGILGEPGPGPAGADPVGHAVGRQRIVVPGELSLFYRNSSDLSALIPPQAAIPQSAFGDSAFIYAEVAGNSTFILRGCFGKSMGSAALSMGLDDERQRLTGFGFQAIRADTDFPGDKI